MRCWLPVRILLDEQLPRQLARHLSGHRARTVQQCGWAGLKNGELLQHAAAGGFEVFVTADQNLTFQQNLTGSALRVIVLVARSNTLEDLLPLVPTQLLATKDARPGEVRQLGSA
jgi:predicted nuclease of predicted toxin-antitoxin system